MRIDASKSAREELLAGCRRNLLKVEYKNSAVVSGWLEKLVEAGAGRQLSGRRLPRLKTNFSGRMKGIIIYLADDFQHPIASDYTRFSIEKSSLLPFTISQCYYPLSC